MISELADSTIMYYRLFHFRIFMPQDFRHGDSHYAQYVCIIHVCTLKELTAGHDAYRA